MDEQVSLWAAKKACDYHNTCVGPDNTHWSPEEVSVSRPIHAIDSFARYIAEHEEPPVDPDLIEARRFKDEWVNGTRKLEEAFLAVIKRGRDLERSAK